MRARKRHRQTEMKLPTWGGKREGAGRPRVNARCSERHRKRVRFAQGMPVHVVARVVDGLGSLRRMDMYRAIRAATVTVALRPQKVRIVQMSVQGSHLHFICEAPSAMGLARGMQSFLISAAKQVNRAVRVRTGRKRTGRVFVDRHHVRVLETPREVRNALAYVLNNWRHHGEDRGAARHDAVDPFSSGVGFWGWKERRGNAALVPIAAAAELLCVWRPKTWLLREGWERHGLISQRHVPGAAGQPDA